MTTRELPATASLTPRRTPEAHVRAEISAWPLASEQAFRDALVELHPDIDPATARLWRDCEGHLAPQAGGWSLDRLIAARDNSWFANEPTRRTPVAMHAYLRKLANDHLDAFPGTTTIRQGDDGALDAHNRYRWLTFALPEDLVLGAVNANPPPQAIDGDPPLLVQRLRDLGLAEIHQHVGAGMDFTLLWDSALAALAGPDIQEDALVGPGVVFGGGVPLVRWLLAVGIARLLIAEVLARRRQQRSPPPGLRDLVRTPGPARAWPFWRRRILARAVGALCTGSEAELPQFADLLDLYRDLHPDAQEIARRPPSTLEEATRRCDPVVVRLRLSGRGTGERWLLLNGLAHIEAIAKGAAPADPWFVKTFWQTVRLRCLFYRTIVERPLTAGLQWFIRFYNRISAFRAPLEAVSVEASYVTAGRHGPLAALEVRMGIAPSSFAIADGLLQLVTSWRAVLASHASAENVPEMGAVLHFVKLRRRGRVSPSDVQPGFWRRTHAEPYTGRQPQDGLRFGDLFVDLWSRARAIADLLGGVPSALWILRGIDVAADELAVPTWVLAPLFHHVRVAALRASARTASEGAPPLGITAHVGEDFRHLMEGLRRVFECMTYLLGPSGGRLGHATALGIAPRAWAESTGSVLVPAEDRLLDLLFEWRLYARHPAVPDLVVDAPPGRPAAIEPEIRDLSARVFDEEYAPQDLADAFHLIHGLLRSRNAPLEEGLLAVQRRAIASGSEILSRYLDDPSVFAAGQKLVQVTIDASEVGALTAVQNALRAAVSARGIVVEVNPSSNLLIGDMLDLRNHPVLRLCPPQPSETVPSVHIAIGSDDPVTFNTHLIREYALLHDAARAAGYPERAVQEWLESIRRTGMDARFTVGWRPSATERARKLESALGRYAQIPAAELRLRARARR